MSPLLTKLTAPLWVPVLALYVAGRLMYDLAREVYGVRRSRGEAS